VNRRKKYQTPAWLVTFADLMALLLTFFVLMLSMSTTDVQRYKTAAESLSEAFGGGRVMVVQEGAGDSVAGEIVPNEIVPSAGRKEQLTHTLSRDVAEGNLELEWQGGDLLIRFPEHVAFAVGSERLTAKFFPVLRKVSDVVAGSDEYVLVSGHTDNQPIYNERFHSNWELSAARAASVIFAMMEYRPTLNQDRFVAQGYADTRPLEDNTTSKGRARNRRVELLIRNAATNPDESQNSHPSVSSPILRAVPVPADSVEP